MIHQDEVHIIPFSGQQLEFERQGSLPIRFAVSEHGFLLGKENFILEPLIQEIVDNKVSPKRLPILFYGGIGTGRTHLLKGLLETWRKNQPSDVVRRRSYYLTAADFVRQYAESVANRMTDEFRNRYHNLNLLLLDDVEQFLGKPSAQAELRQLLDVFATDNHTLILTMQTLPNEMETGKYAPFGNDLTARLLGGTTIPIFPPGEAVRRRFLKDLASALRIPVTETLLNAAAKNLTGTIPQLYGGVVQKYVENKAENLPLDTAFWQQFTRKRQSKPAENIADIAKRTAAYFSLKLSDLKGESRSKNIILVRSITVYLARSQYHLTFKEIGTFFGKRDPSTIRHLFEKIENALPNEPALRDHLFRLGTR